MNKTLISLLLIISSTPIFAKTLHISPEIKFGPYVGAGISGGGIQLGVADIFGLDAVYLSYSHTSAELLNLNKDRLKTYRLGAQHQLVNEPKISLQLEGGFVEYEGKRNSIIGSSSRKREGQGASVSASLVIAVTDNLAFRVGTDFNYIDEKNTFLAYSLSATVSTGIVLSF